MVPPCCPAEAIGTARFSVEGRLTVKETPFPYYGDCGLTVMTCGCGP
jgi:hypothetical protein